jgi:S-adenosylmethionine-diacylglycerol 3-amino-3-carboxypropyl transferase
VGNAERWRQHLDEKFFNAIYSRSLVYNACWEDPAVDRLALNLSSNDTLLVITSAGCNTLDYALCAPRRIHAVDANPRQNALLELKCAGIRRLEHDDFFALFGAGRHPDFPGLYRDRLRRDLSPFAQAFWDRRASWFSQDSRGLYFQGLAGKVARLFQFYLTLRPLLRRAIERLFESRTLDEQRDIYDTRVAPRLWSRELDWALSRGITMSMLGVPYPQHEEVRRQHAQGVPGFVREAVGYVCRQLPIRTNYFWRLYVEGGFDRQCCPEYLKRDNFLALKGGLVDRIAIHTATVTQFLNGTDERISRYVLLDHMDWMSSFYPLALSEEWEAILGHAAPGARILFRSAHAEPSYLDDIAINWRGARARVLDFLSLQRDLAARLQPLDRVHTYAGLHVADVRASGVWASDV